MSLIPDERVPEGVDRQLSEYLQRMFLFASMSDDRSSQHTVLTTAPDKPIVGKLYYFGNSVAGTNIYREGFYWYNSLSNAWESMGMGDFFHEVAAGGVPGHSLVHKFGKHDSVPSAYAPLALGGVYRTPQVGGATTLRIKAGGHVNDNQAGSGALSVLIEGFDILGNHQTEILLPHATDGSLVGVDGVKSFIRGFRSHVYESGSYANTTTSSHDGDIVIENTAGSEDWMTIRHDDLGKSQSQIGVYPVPLGFTAYVYNYVLTTDDNKPVDFIFFKREGILDTAAPYQPIRTVVEEVGITGHFDGAFKGGQKFEELTDIGWMARGAGTPIVTCDFEILLVDNNYL